MENFYMIFQCPRCLCYLEIKDRGYLEGGIRLVGCRLHGSIPPDRVKIKIATKESPENLKGFNNRTVFYALKKIYPGL